MKIAVHLLAFCALAAGVTSIAAQPKTPSPEALAAAAKAAPPTNNTVDLSAGAGEVVVVNSTGFLLKNNDTYLPRIALTNVTESDLRALLESRTFYNSLTVFAPGGPRTAASRSFEAQLRSVWQNGPSLAEKIQTRAAILDLMRNYNAALAAYNNSMGFANNAAVINQSALADEQLQATASSNAIAQLEAAKGGRHEAWHELRSADRQFDNDTVRATGAANLTSTMQQNAEIYYQNARFFAAHLAALGVRVTSNPAFVPVPPLSLRLEVDLDRLAKK